MMSKQAWRFVLKRNKNTKGREEREKERGQRGEKRKLGAQHKNHLAMRHKKTKIMPVTTYTVRTTGGTGNPPSSPNAQKNKTIIHRFKEVTPPGHMAETPTCTNCILGTQRDPSRASPLWETWRMDGMTGRGC